MQFYKYQAINSYTIDGLKARKLWCADPFTFNDPFEFRLMQLSEDEIYKVKGLDRLRHENPDLSHLNDQELFFLAISELQNYIYTFRVTCFTEHSDNILMWAHYAQNHTGICLGFDVDDPKKEGLYKVKYSDEYPLLDLEKVWSIDGTAKVLLTKSAHWSYENEWRKMFTGLESFLYDYPGKFIEVILGAKISESDEVLIRETLKDSNIRIRKAYLHPKRYELVLE